MISLDCGVCNVKTGVTRYPLAKGRPPLPAQPLSDVQPWEDSGNRCHRTEKAVGIPTPLIESFSKPGSLVLDPFSGSGSTAVAAALTERRFLGIEPEQRYCSVAERRLEGVVRCGGGRIVPASAIERG